MKKANARSALRDFNGTRAMVGMTGAASNGGTYSRQVPGSSYSATMAAAISGTTITGLPGKNDNFKNQYINLRKQAPSSSSTGLSNTYGPQKSSQNLQKGPFPDIQKKLEGSRQILQDI